MHPLHVLTPLTGKEAAEKRTVVIGTVELNWRLFVVLATSAIPALIMTAFAWPMVGEYSVLVFPAVLIASSTLFYRRSSKGMRLRTYQAILDKKKARDIGQFYLCGEPVDIAPTHFKQLLHNTVRYGSDEHAAEIVVASRATVTRATRKGDGHTWHGSALRDQPTTTTFTDRYAASGEMLAGALRARRRRDPLDNAEPQAPESQPLHWVPTMHDFTAPVAAPVVDQPVAPGAVERPAPVAVPPTRPVVAQAPQSSTPQHQAPTQTPVPAEPSVTDPFDSRPPEGNYETDDIDPAVFFDTTSTGRRKRA